MHYIINQRNDGEDELILNYQTTNKEVEAIIAFMEKSQKKLMGRVDNEKVLFSPDEILYFEVVDDKTFAYTLENVIQMDISLSMVESILQDTHFFRCAKSMIVHIDKVERLKSLPSNRIDATLSNGEHIMISRTYASDFRRLLKGE